MTMKGQRAWLKEGEPGEERERLLKLREETEACREPRKLRRAAPKKEVRRTPIQKFFQMGFSVIFWVLVAGLIAIMFTAFQSKREGGIPSVLGISVFKVQTGSMVPTLPIGSFVIVHAASDPSALEAGTIATFYRSDGMVVTHRIIDVLTAEDGTVEYQTKGDNPENSPDAEHLTPDRVIGTYLFKITLPSIWGGD